MGCTHPNHCQPWIHAWMGHIWSQCSYSMDCTCVITASHGVHGWHTPKSLPTMGTYVDGTCPDYSVAPWIIDHTCPYHPLPWCVDDTCLSLPAMVYMDGTSRSLPAVDYMCLTMECIRGWHMSRWWCSYKRGSHYPDHTGPDHCHEGHHVHITASHNISAYLDGTCPYHDVAM